MKERPHERDGDEAMSAGGEARWVSRWGGQVGQQAGRPNDVTCPWLWMSGWICMHGQVNDMDANYHPTANYHPADFQPTANFYATSIY